MIYWTFALHIDVTRRSAVGIKSAALSNRTDVLDKPLDIAKHNEEAIAWANKYIVKKGNSITFDGCFKINVEFLDHPEILVAIRTINDPHVKDIMENIKLKGVLAYKIVVLIWKEECEKAGIDPKNPNFNFVRKPNMKFQVICGDHTGEAIKLLHVDEPTNKKYQKVTCKVIICEKNDENIKYANTYGGLDNFVASTSLTSNIVDITINMHDKFLEIDNTRMTDNKRQKKKKDHTRYFLCGSWFQIHNIGKC